MEEFKDLSKNIKIVANKITLGIGVSFGNNVDISIKGDFELGDYSHLGNDIHIRGNNVKFGKHLFNSSGLRIGGGGRQHPNANFEIGDRCTIHNNFINICEPVKIGDDVGLSPDVSILTHGYWQSVLEGFPATFEGVTIGNGVIVGFKSIIMMGASIADYCVIGANSVITKPLLEKGIYAGTPAKFIKGITPLSDDDRKIKIDEIINVHYLSIAKYHGIKPDIKIKYPFIEFNKFRFNVLTFEYWGEEDEETDDLRDYIRKWGIRIYTERPFRSKF
jgi:acetyltransferase-like isoleucine patch superfamily enzyme|tara:strand:+ start:8072 stop:8899 length:828 start_codon:yes stop_codon:yes gene_type:complete